MKRFLVLLAALMLCSGLAACESNQNVVESVISQSDEITAQNDEPVAQSTVKQVTLSGRADDTFIAGEHCYAEGEKIFLYFEKGVTVRGDMLELTERIMDELSAYTGLGFEKNCIYNADEVFLGKHVPKSDFNEVNTGDQKIDVLIMHNPDKYAVQQAYPNGVVLDMYDYDFDETGWQNIYHELAHVIHLRNGANLGYTMTEGYAEYTSYMTMKQQKLPVWSTIQYFTPVQFDDSIIDDGENGFMCSFDPKIYSYHYGFRFITFLSETYGSDIFFKITGEAENRYYRSIHDIEEYDLPTAFGKSNAQLADIIKSQTDDDVFEKFVSWNKTQWDQKYQEYKDYMNSIGQVIDW